MHRNKKLFLRKKFGKCANCGDTKNLTIDHIIPKSKGGSGRWRNLQVLCEKCNLEKGDKLIDIDTMKIYLTTDTHLGHLEKMLEWGIRPENYEKQIIKALGFVPRGSLVIHLGDVAISGDEENNKLILDALKGCHTVLVRGNHDRKSEQWYLEQGWGFVCVAFMGKYFGKKIIFTHKPVPKPYSEIEYNIHGHTHGQNHHEAESASFYNTDFNKEFALEKDGYAPVSLEKLLKSYEPLA